MIDSVAGMDTRVRSVMMCGGARALSGEDRGQGRIMLSETVQHGAPEDSLVFSSACGNP